MSTVSNMYIDWLSACDLLPVELKASPVFYFVAVSTANVDESTRKRKLGSCSLDYLPLRLSSQHMSKHKILKRKTLRSTSRPHSKRCRSVCKHKTDPVAILQPQFTPTTPLAAAQQQVEDHGMKETSSRRSSSPRSQNSAPISQCSQPAFVGALGGSAATEMSLALDGVVSSQG